MITVREPATDADIGAVTQRDRVRSYGAIQVNLEHSCAIVDEDGTVLGCCGIAPMFENTCEVWSVFSQRLLDRHALSLTRGAVSMLDKWRRDGAFKRVTAMTPAEDRFSGWLEVLGFEREGLMKHFGPGAEGDWCVMGLSH